MNSSKLKDILFLDIETIPQAKSFDCLPEKMRDLWAKKSKQLRKVEEDTPAELYHQRAGIFAEFGKIICISIGYIIVKNTKITFRNKTLAEEDEKLLLENFNEHLNRFCQHKNKLLCAHNGKEFDFPYIIRRMLVHGIPLPPILQMFGKKPWEIPFLDTMEMWKFGDYKNYTSLELLSTIFQLPSPKDDIDGDVFASEASRCENVIYPIIREVYKNFVDRYTLWSHKSISIDNQLTGTPDYLISTKSELGKTVLGLPVLVVVEAKQNNFMEGWGQCVAELLAAQKINQNDENFVYGVVVNF